MSVLMSFFKKSFIVNIILILLAISVSYSAARMVRDVFVVRTESKEITQKIEELTRKKQELELALAEIQTKEAVEREAKARLNLKKSGEEVVVVVPEKKISVSQDPPVSFWSRFMSLFTSLFP